MQSIAVIPAAGRSVRMGQAKLLLPWRGRRVIEHVLDAWRRSHVSHTVVVVRADDRTLLAALERQPVQVVAADPAPQQMKDSVACGLDFAQRAFQPQPSDVWLLAPADMPRLSAATIDRLLEQHDPTQPCILVPRAGEKNGHPVLFPWPLAAEVARLGPADGIHRLRERFPVRTVGVDDCSAFDDLDTPDDYLRLGP